MERSEERGWVDLTRGVPEMEQCTGPLPDVSAPVRTLVETLLAKDRRAETPPRGILMDPGNSYLCVVAARGQGDGKAFLLADDTKITDPAILAQLGQCA
ncbi:hypothetical protein [Streptomyces canus]|uniref:hypothetical protein n=1 Tax=Streptomyces canus TaxID=58343 RepID=UPI0032513604